MSRELLAILKLFEGHGVPALPYKGPVLAAAEYGNIAARTFCDLDILIRKEDVSRARDLLVARGYLNEHQLESAHERVWLRGRNDVNLRRPDLDVVVELHWDIVLPRMCVSFDIERLWARTQTFSLGGRDVQTLSPEDLLLVLCVHGAKHGWARRMWIDDVAAVVSNHPELDWTDLFDEAKRMGVRRILTVGLSLAAELGGCRLPDSVQRVLSDRGTTVLATAVREWLATDAPGSEHALRRSLFHVRIRERIRDKIRGGLCAAFVPSDKDRLLVGLPPAFAILYYLLRPIRLAGKYWQRVVSRPITT